MSTTPSNPVQSRQPKGVEALAHYVAMRAAQPMLNLGASVHSIHLGTEFAAEITFYDLAHAVNSHATLTARVEELTFQLDTSRLSVHNAEVENDRPAERIAELLQIVEAIPGTPDEMPDEPCDELCGNSWCNEFGCIANKIRDARAVLQPKGGGMSARTFYQSHECEGFRAKVTIEWSMPDRIDGDLLPTWRRQDAEDIADAILSFSGRRMRQMVQVMRGYKSDSKS